MLDALTLDQMRALVAVADSGSFRAAATRLLRVQSAVSHAIANLENQLGVSLFDRSGHRPTLTPEGRALLEDARAILLKVDAMRARARGLGEGVELGLSIVVDTLFPIAIVGGALKALHGTYPTVGVRLSVAPLGAPLAALREGRCTLGITVGEDFRDPRIELEALSSLSFVAVAAASLGRTFRRRRATRSDRTGGPSANRPGRSHIAIGGTRLRRVVSRNLAGERPGHEAGSDPCRHRLGQAAVMDRRTRSGRGASRPDRGRRVGSARRNHDGCLSGASDR